MVDRTQIPAVFAAMRLLDDILVAWLLGLVRGCTLVIFASLPELVNDHHSMRFLLGSRCIVVHLDVPRSHTVASHIFGVSVYGKAIVKELGLCLVVKKLAALLFG